MKGLDLQITMGMMGSSGSRGQLAACNEEVVTTTRVQAGGPDTEG